MSTASRCGEMHKSTGKRVHNLVYFTLYSDARVSGVFLSSGYEESICISEEQTHD